MYRDSLCIALALCATLIVGGCNNAKSPSTVAKDVNSASQKAEHVAAVQDEKTAKSDAEGQRDIALAKCEALSGDRQQACKDEANAAYDMSVAQAKQAKAESDPKR